MPCCCTSTSKISSLHSSRRLTDRITRHKVSHLLDLGHNPLATTAAGVNMLHVAGYGDDRVSTLRAVLDHDKVPSDLLLNQRESKMDFTPLMIAGIFGSHECLVELLKRGASPDLRSSSGTTVLHGASYSRVGRARTVEYLLNNSSLSVNDATRWDRYGYKYAGM